MGTPWELSAFFDFLLAITNTMIMAAISSCGPVMEMRSFIDFGYKFEWQNLSFLINCGFFSVILTKIEDKMTQLCVHSIAKQGKVTFQRVVGKDFGEDVCQSSGCSHRGCPAA